MISASQSVLDRLVALIDDEYDSDAAFERELGLPPKTVNNWRRGRSSSYMRMLPRLAECFGVSISALLDMPIGQDSSELSEDEAELLNEYRRASSLSQKEKAALKRSLLEIIGLYTTSREKTSSRAPRRGVKKS